MDWKEKFKEHLTAAGNMKRSLDTRTKTEIFQYRVADKFKVMGFFGKTNKDPVLCKCLKCDLVSSIVPDDAVRDKAACKVCMGTVKRNLAGVPEHLVEKLPGHVCIKGINEAYRGVVWLDMDTVKRDALYIVEHKRRDLYSFVTLDYTLFNSKEDAKLFAGGIQASGDALDLYHQEVPDMSVPHVLWRGWDHCKYAVWDTKYASIIKYCLEKKYKKKRVYMGYEDYAFHLTLEDLKELSAITDIEDILNWKL